MSAPAPDSLAVAREVDALCDRYEDALRRGTAGPLDNWLPAGGPARAAALAELVRLEFEHRLQGGESVRVEDYFSRYPELRADAGLAARLVAAERRPRPDALPTIDPAETRATDPPSSTVPAARPLPEQFGRYRIVRVLGQGGMGTVYQAQDTKLDRPVALKVMRFGADDPEQVERFYREARIAASFTHPNLCPVYDAGRRDGVHYLTMPLIGGEPLAGHLRREGRMPERAAAALAALIARAVHEAHRAGVLHRDLKPANVMINERRQPVVMDFGLARRFGPLDPRTTAPGVLVGTPAYMCPEQVAGGSEAGGPAQDVYSLGVILYEMLTGRLPFAGTLSEILTQVLVRAPEPPSNHRPGLDPRLEHVCLTALAKHPRERFPSMQALAEALEGCAKADAPVAQPAARAPRHRLAVVGLLLGVAGLAVGGAALIAWSLHNPTASGSSTPAVTSTPALIKPGTEPQLVLATGGFQAGNEWTGSLRWDMTDYDRPVKVVVQERTDNRFVGVYFAEDGWAYSWRIEGTVEGARVKWEFKDKLSATEPMKVANAATVEGTLSGNLLNGSFQGAETPRGRLTLKATK